MYQNVSLSVNKHEYPDTEVSTIGARFYQMQLVANELDGTLEATKEFEDSFTDPLNDTTTGTRYKNCRSDGTSFGINFQLVSASTSNWNVQMLATFSMASIRIRRLYPFHSRVSLSIPVIMTLIISLTQTIKINILHRLNFGFVRILTPPPELWICQDTYFTMSTDGLRYYGPETPEGYA